MLEMGQHSCLFSKASLEGNQLAVKVAEQESKFKTPEWAKPSQLKKVIF